MEQDMEILQGVISSVVFENYDNGYTVLRLSLGGGQTVTVVFSAGKRQNSGIRRRLLHKFGVIIPPFAARRLP